MVTSEQPLRGVSILLVDDDDDGREMLQLMLRHAGASVTTASSAIEGFERFKAAPPTMLVTDIAMPHLDGLWLLESVRSVPGLPRTPAIAVTALAAPADGARIRAGGFDAHLVKPVDADALLSCIATLAGLR
jgi:CheY-like chemotaxis protein